MNMTNDSSVFVILWQVNCRLKKKIYTDPQHNMQKNNIKITCQSLAHWVKSPKQASEIRVWTSSFWFKSHEMSNRLLHGFILHISSITHNIPVSTSYDIWAVTYTCTCIFSLWVSNCRYFSSNTVTSCKSNALHCVLVLSQSEHKVIQMLLSSDDVHIWTLYCYHTTDLRLLVFTHGRVTTVSPFPPAVFLFLGHPVL